MTQQFHFISGLPRSGSTLLSALLRQNPHFHAHMTSPLSGLFGSMLTEMSGRNEFSMFIDDRQRQRMLAGLFENYYADLPEEVIFDTGRAWCARLPALTRLFPNARMIACVRHISWIIDSIERVVRRNAFRPSSIFNYSAGGTVYTRANGLASSEGMVGNAYDALREAFYGEHANCLMLVQYETLSTSPDSVMSAIYDFIGEPAFSHDFENVTFDASEFDDRIGTPGLHDIHSRVAPAPRDTILPPDLFQRFAHDAFWSDPKRNPRSVLVV